MTEAPKRIMVWKDVEGWLCGTWARTRYPDGAVEYILAAEHQRQMAEADAEIARLRDALTPSTETKATYIGEFSFALEDRDENGDECVRKVTVPWTSIKEVMAAILARAALGDDNG